MFLAIKNQCDTLSKQFGLIPEERKKQLEIVSKYIRSKKEENKTVNLVYICTHNSRRSIFGQIWAAVAASFYGVSFVNTFSGGTMETAFHPNAIAALRSAGFKITTEMENSNPHYTVAFSENQSLECFSKVFDSPSNPSNNFAAILTCSHAEENCPFISGADLRIGLTYDDPKEFDGTALQTQKYVERSNQIALESLYLFHKISN